MNYLKPTCRLPAERAKPLLLLVLLTSVVATVAVVVVVACPSCVGAVLANWVWAREPTESSADSLADWALYTTIQNHQK